MSPEQVLDFWFSDTAAKRWFRATAAFDKQIRERFETGWRAAAAGELATWQRTPSGALALVILLDQFPLNMFRGEPGSFSTEGMAREVAGRAIDRGFDARLSDPQKMFLYLPFMHSEILADQDRAVALFARAGLKDNLRWARHHREIIQRFGRFPHRNAILGRADSPQEQAWLASPEAFRP